MADLVHRCLFACALACACVVAQAADGRADEAPEWVEPLADARITSGFAMRRHPIKKRRLHHSGVDFAAPQGTPVRVVDDGVVAFAGQRRGYGNVIHVAHAGSGRTTMYAHLHRIDVRTGEQVAQGQVIGTVGRTGLASGPHLHFEVHERGKPIDPMTLAYGESIAPRTDSAVVAVPAVPCVDLLQKASLEALDATELTLLRQGCLR